MNNIGAVTQLLEELAQFLLTKIESQSSDSSVVLEINTLDNPGWMISSILIPGIARTGSGSKSVGAFDEESQYWWTCIEEEYGESSKVLMASEAIVSAYGGPSYLPIIVEKVYSRVVNGALDENVVVLSDELISNLSSWLLVQCDGNWEHSEGIGIVMTSTGQWRLQATNVSTHLLRKKIEREKPPRFPILGTRKTWLRDPVMIDQCWYHDSADIGGLADMLETFLNNSELDPAGLPNSV
ncbi:MAG: hypothetical protein J0I17_10290 ['Candidatus Kapabacteria' thiocyanatum]|uniref:Uncharacterized protein n=1 Tax=Candidatus Kapaibacterium thiocyanatum TaxID=1895771 RepID=A0A1M3KUY4_9BACT|nr:hypothetical protein ['Candidatus Kapabacteria' thiocyanatum]OJX56187.1 MAG: hypothetical protein BGO89_12645 ['Candidatus Kapabacteria' thiocyanatum]